MAHDKRAVMIYCIIMDLVDNAYQVESSAELFDISFPESFNKLSHKYY